MATIQIRDIPEDAYEVLRRRARADGRSIQSYMREQVIEMTSARTKAEHLAAIEERLERLGAGPADRAQVLADLDADRR